MHIILSLLLYFIPYTVIHAAMCPPDRASTMHTTGMKPIRPSKDSHTVLYYFMLHKISHRRCTATINVWPTMCTSRRLFNTES